MTAPFNLSITSVFTPEQQPRGSAHEKAFAQQIQTGGVYLGFRTLRGRKFPHGNFRTSVFCEVKTQIAGFFDSLGAYSINLLYALFMALQSLSQ